ncbi:MAG: ABC transporter permease [Hespellia sp.]|nr:ABC transporter permease [Hespellia sp.]
MGFEKNNVISFIIKGSRVIVLVLLFLVFTIFTKNFFGVGNSSNVVNILLQTAPFEILLALGMIITMITGGIDLSIGANITISSFMCAMVLQYTGNSLAGIVTGLLVGITIGIINGILIAFVGLPPFVATYSMDWIVKGAVLVISQGGQINGFDKYRAIFNTWRGSYLLISIAVLILAWFLYSKTTFGKKTYFVGANPSAGELSGINSKLIVILAYAACGFVAAVAGLLYIAKLGAAEPTLGNSFTMAAFAAALIGGASFAGGKSRVLGALVGGLIIVVLNNGLIHIGVPGIWQDFAQGLVIIVAVFLERLMEKLQEKNKKGNNEKSL